MKQTCMLLAILLLCAVLISCGSNGNSKDISASASDISTSSTSSTVSADISASSTSSTVSADTSASSTSSIVSTDISASSTTQSFGWYFVDGNGRFGINKDTASYGIVPDMIVFNSKLYIGWFESGQLRIAVYNGNDSAPFWQYVDGNGVNGINSAPTQTWLPPSSRPCLSVFNSKLYISWIEDNYQVRVKVYNGNDSAPAWSFVENSGSASMNKNPLNVTEQQQLIVLNSKLYALWKEVDRISLETTNEVRVYNGIDSSPAWSPVATTGLPVAVTGAPKFTVFNSKLYALFDTPTVHVYVYNGNDASPNWLGVDGISGGINRMAFTNALDAQLRGFDDKLYAVWSESVDVGGSGYLTVRVAVYNGNDTNPMWAFVDGNGPFGLNKDYTQAARTPQLSTVGSKLYAIWSEDTLFGIPQVRVALYNGDDSLPSWSFVDGNAIWGINKDCLSISYNPQLIAFNGKPYASWSEQYRNAAFQIRIAVGR